MGIGGSGMSAAAAIAASQGYQVSGSDIDPNSPYLAELKQFNIPLLPLNNLENVNNSDIFTVSPFYLFSSYPEVELAKSQQKLSTWQDFAGNYLHKNKFVIAIAGTHGKSTTTAMAGSLLEAAKLDPTVLVGAKVKFWETNFKIGLGKYFVTEADEFNDNFKSYHPDILILNNIEMDHPEYFQTESNLLAHFQRLIDRTKQLIYNSNSPLIHKLNLPSSAISYSLSEFPPNLHLQVPGDHNKSNALGILKLADILNIPTNISHKALSNFTGLSRRIELIHEQNNIRVYDDYANHPSAFKAVINTLKNLHPDSKLIAIIEPHTYSRLKAVLTELPNSLNNADQIIFTEIFASREINPGNFTSNDLVIASKHPNASYIPNFSDIILKVSHITPPATIVVMGSGSSSKLAHQIASSLK